MPPTISQKSPPPPASGQRGALPPRRDALSARRGRRLGVWPEAIAVLVLALATLIPGIVNTPLVRTEPHRAVPAHEMVTTGKWLMPRIYGVPYLRKPPLHYWALAATERVIGRTDEWVYRVPSVVATALIALAACIAAAAWFGAGDPTGRVGRIAGSAAGVATLALVPLWGQARTADVDALNTLLTAAAAWLSMELLRRRGARAMTIAAALAVAFGAMTLTKGPAGWPVVAGAIAATWWCLRPMQWRALVQLGSSLLIGLLLLVGWGLLAYLSLRGEEGAFDWTGVGEAAGKLNPTDLARFGRSLGLPFVVAAFCMPVVLALPFLGELRRVGQGAADSTVASSMTMAKASALAFVAALAIGALGGLDNMRYIYPAVPLLAPLVGALAAAWCLGALLPERERSLRGILTGSVVGFGLATLALSIIAWRIVSANGGTSLLAIGLLVVIVPVVVITVRAWIRESLRPALGGTVLVVALTGLAFGEWRAQWRSQLSAVDAAAVLRATVGADATVLSGVWVMADPALFHYAGVNVEYQPRGLRPWTKFHPGGWVVFEEDEWAALPSEFQERFDSMQVLPVRARDALLLRYRPIDATPAPTPTEPPVAVVE